MLVPLTAATKEALEGKLPSRATSPELLQAVRFGGTATTANAATCGTSAAAAGGGGKLCAGSARGRGR